MNTIEEKLWNYIDGSCSSGEQEAITRLIESDEVYRRKYHELLDLNQEFAGMELEDPPMAFTFNVMEAIRAEEARVPLKASINKHIIWGIAGFFILTISALIIYTLFSINWVASPQNQQSLTDHMPQLKVPEFKLPKLSSFMNTPVLKGFLFFDVVVGLFFFDSYLRKQQLNKQI